MWRRHCLLRAAVARSYASQSHAQSAGSGFAVPAELAELVSLRGSGMVRVPEAVAAGLEAAAADLSSKAVKQHGQRLSERLRHMSRTRHRGGAHPGLRERQAAAALAAAPVASSQLDDGEAGSASLQAMQQQGQAEGRRGKRRQSRQRALKELALVPLLPVTPGTDPDLASYWQHREVAAKAAAAAADSEAGTGDGPVTAATIAAAGGQPLYDQVAAVAYAAARMPACYAALQRVLSEVRQLRPGYQPSTVLDFGAGPGTATWAAQQVWPDRQLEVTAVEPAWPMTWLGTLMQEQGEQRYQQYQQQQQQQQTQAGDMKMSATPMDSDSARSSDTDERRSSSRVESESSSSSSSGMESESSSGSDSEVGIYSGVSSEGEAEGGEGEEVEAEEGPASPPVPPSPVPPRMLWQRSLWRERGGQYRQQGPQLRRYDLVVAGYVLGELRGEAERRRVLLDLWQRTGGLLVLVEPGTPVGAAHIQQARSLLLPGLSEKQQQQDRKRRRRQQQQPTASGSGSKDAAHVVAPCPHDGVCPLVGRPSWCHFVQRFERPPLQRLAKSLGPRAARTYQDERFSYLVLARGPRPAMQAQPAIHGSYLPALVDMQPDVPAGLKPKRVPPGQLNVQEFFEPEGQDADSSGMLESGADGGLERADGGSKAGMHVDDDEEEEEEVLEWGDLQEIDEATKQLVLESILGADAYDEDGGDAADSQRAAELDAEISALLAQQAAQQQATEGKRHRTPARQLPLGPEFEQTAAAAAAEGLPPDQADWEGRHPQAAAELRAAGLRWARVLRVPRKRSGHVVLDLCCAAGPQPSPTHTPPLLEGGVQGQTQQEQGATSSLQQQQQQQEQHLEQGVLLRQVVSRAVSKRHAGGVAPYKLARRLRWGDAWPAPYQALFPAAQPPSTSQG